MLSSIQCNFFRHGCALSLSLSTNPPKQRWRRFGWQPWKLFAQQTVSQIREPLRLRESFSRKLRRTICCAPAKKNGPQKIWTPWSKACFLQIVCRALLLFVQIPSKRKTLQEAVALQRKEVLGSMEGCCETNFVFWLRDSQSQRLPVRSRFLVSVDATGSSNKK